MSACSLAESQEQLLACMKMRLEELKERRESTSSSEAALLRDELRARDCELQRLNGLLLEVRKEKEQRVGQIDQGIQDFIAKRERDFQALQKQLRAREEAGEAERRAGEVQAQRIRQLQQQLATAESAKETLQKVVQRSVEQLRHEAKQLNQMLEDNEYDQTLLQKKMKEALERQSQAVVRAQLAEKALADCRTMLAEARAQKQQMAHKLYQLTFTVQRMEAEADKALRRRQVLQSVENDSAQTQDLVTQLKALVEGMGAQEEALRQESQNRAELFRKANQLSELTRKLQFQNTEKSYENHVLRQRLEPGYLEQHFEEVQPELFAQLKAKTEKLGKVDEALAQVRRRIDALEANRNRQEMELMRMRINQLISKNDVLLKQSAAKQEQLQKLQSQLNEVNLQSRKQEDKARQKRENRKRKSNSCGECGNEVKSGQSRQNCSGCGAECHWTCLRNVRGGHYCMRCE